VTNCLLLATALNPWIGYDNAAKIAKTALEDGNGPAFREDLQDGMVGHRFFMGVAVAGIFVT
jgi:fumarate hydratase class II